MVRAAVQHEWLARDGIDLSFDDRHRAPRTAGDRGPLSAQSDPETVARLGAVDPRPTIVGRDRFNADPIFVRRGGGNGGV